MEIFKSKVRPSQIIRDTFKDKKVDDVFEISIDGYTINQIRANIHDVMKKTTIKYKTTVKDNKLFILITEV